MTAMHGAFSLSSFNFYCIDHVNMCAASTIIVHSQHLTNPTNTSLLTQVLSFRRPHIVHFFLSECVLVCVYLTFYSHLATNHMLCIFPILHKSKEYFKIFAEQALCILAVMCDCVIYVRILQYNIIYACTVFVCTQNWMDARTAHTHTHTKIHIKCKCQTMQIHK